MFACLVSWVAGLLFVHLLEGKTSGPVVVSVSGILSLIISCVVDVAVLVVNAVVTLPVYVVTRPFVHNSFAWSRGSGPRSAPLAGGNSDPV